VIWMITGNVCGIFLARWLGPHDRGLLALALLLPSTAMTFVKLGISQANVYCINREKTPIEAVASNAAALAVVSGVLSAIVVWLFRHQLTATVLRDLPLWALAFAVVRIPPLLLDDYLYGVLQATGHFRLYNVRQVVGEVIRLVLVVVTVVVLNGGLAAAVVVQAFVTMVNVGWLILAARRVFPFTLRVDGAILRRQLRFGFKSYVQTLTSHLLFRADLFLVSFFLGPAPTAFYSMSQRFPELLLEIPQAVGLVLYPRLASVSEDEAHRLTAQACRRTLMLIVPGAVVLVSIGEFLITLWYGRAYAPASAPLPWVTVGVVMMALYLIVTRDFTSRNLQQVNTAVGAVALTSNFLLDLYMIPRWGIVGAAVSVAIAYSGACAMLLFLYLRASGLSLTDVVVPKPEDWRFFLDAGQRGIARGRQLMKVRPAPADG